MQPLFYNQVASSANKKPSPMAAHSPHRCPACSRSCHTPGPRSSSREMSRGVRECCLKGYWSRHQVVKAIKIWVVYDAAKVTQHRNCETNLFLSQWVSVGPTRVHMITRYCTNLNRPEWPGFVQDHRSKRQHLMVHSHAISGFNVNKYIYTV